MNCAKIFISALAAAALSSPVAAWEFSKGDKRCLAEEYYEAEGKGTTYLSFFISVDDNTSGLMVSNRDWSAKEGAEYNLTYYLDAGGYKDHFSIGYEEYPEGKYGRKGFITFFEPAFAGYFAKSTFIKIRKGDVLVDHLDLEGSAKAVAWVQNCVAEIKEAERKRKAAEEKFSHIPKDPFAVD